MIRLEEQRDQDETMLDVYRKYVLSMVRHDEEDSARIITESSNRHTITDNANYIMPKLPTALSTTTLQIHLPIRLCYTDMLGSRTGKDGTT